MHSSAKILHPEIERRFEAANINQISYLATDYLNHFNEVVMLFWMVADMPEIFEDIESWRPKSYVQYFKDSDFRMKEAVIRAYELSLPQFRNPFDELVLNINQLIIQTVDTLRSGLDAGLSGSSLTKEIDQLTAHVHEQLETLSNVINAADYNQESDPQFTGDDMVTLNQKGIDLFFPDHSDGAKESLSTELLGEKDQSVK